MIRAGIIGGSGYVAGELIRCLIHHPEVELSFIFSHSKPGVGVQEIHQDLFWQEAQHFSDEIVPDVDVIFLAQGHGKTESFLDTHPFAAHTRFVDMSNAFRLKAKDQWQDRKFIYGLPELQADQIAAAQAIANPGCFATAIQLALLPLAKAGWLDNAVHIHAVTGATGAGQAPKPTTHFSWRNNNLSVYKAFRHQHLGEIKDHLPWDGDGVPLHFLPLRGDFARGIFATLHTELPHSEAELQDLYAESYRDTPFAHLVTGDLHLKQVVNTNHCAVQVQKIDDQVLIISAIDNLLKGAAGQAIQNLNLMFGLPQETGLNFKASYF